MALWTSHEIKKVTGGESTGNWTVNGVSIDSRTIQIGDLFVALTDKRDGHCLLYKYPRQLDKRGDRMPSSE